MRLRVHSVPYLGGDVTPAVVFCYIDGRGGKHKLEMLRAMFKSAWDQRRKQMQAAVVSVKRDLAKLDKQIDGLLDRIVNAESPALIKAYEKRLAKFERDKI